MRDFYQSSLGLTGSLLIAHPNLLDPNFRRTVLLIGAHDPVEGAFGLVLNREANRVVSEIVEESGLGPLGDVPVYYGGPVARDRLTFASFQWHVAAQKMECRTNLELYEAQRLALEPDVVIRGYVGYSGWSAGQLETELEAKAWLVQLADQELLDAQACKQIWFDIMQQYGPWFRLLALTPDDPTLN